MLVYNTLTRGKDALVPLQRGKLKIYTCGPTVYDFAHIGNFRAYVFQDVFKRYVKYRGFEVTHVMNITDVDDKTIKNSQRERVALHEFTSRYERAFFEDLETLNIEKADICPRATEHVGDMVKTIKSLMDKGYAYRGKDGSVYFNISKFEGYGNLAGINPEDLKPSRVKSDEYAKDEARDFALWKAHTEEDGDVFWDTEIGRGRPGWHIECSAMSTKYLGDTFDIHMGGVDLIFPHHENEIAQAEAVTCRKFVNYWLHNEHLLVEGKKMSKSLGNYYTPRDLISRGYDPRAIRYLLLATHYRKKMNFTLKALGASENTVKRLIDFIRRISGEMPDGKYDEHLSKIAKDAKTRFESAMDDDLDIRHALAAIFGLVRETNRAMERREVSKENLDEVHRLMMGFDSVLGVLSDKKDDISSEFLDLIVQRERARKEKDFETADSIRAELFERGVVLEDVGEGTKWKHRRT